MEEAYYSIPSLVQLPSFQVCSRRPQLKSQVLRSHNLGGLPPLRTPYAVNLTEVMAVTDLPAGEGGNLNGSKYRP